MSSPSSFAAAADARGVADQDRLDQAALGRHERAAERIVVFGADDGGLQRRQLRGQRDQRAEMVAVSTISAGRSRASVTWVTVGASTTASPSHTTSPVGVLDPGLEHGDRLLALLAADDLRP